MEGKRAGENEDSFGVRSRGNEDRALAEEKEETKSKGGIAQV